MGLQPNVSTLYLKSIGINHRDIKKKRDLILPNKGMDININIRDTSKEKFNKKQQAIELLKEGYSYVAVGKKFNVSDNAIRKWVKSMNIDPKSFQFYKNKDRKIF
jgi:DNA-binding NarL/FixJ family response regulator